MPSKQNSCMFHDRRKFKDEDFSVIFPGSCESHIVSVTQCDLTVYETLTVKPWDGLVLALKILCSTIPSNRPSNDCGEILILDGEMYQPTPNFVLEFEIKSYMEKFRVNFHRIVIGRGRSGGSSGFDHLSTIVKKTNGLEIVTMTKKGFHIDMAF